MMDRRLLLRITGWLGGGTVFLLGGNAVGHGIYCSWSINSFRQPVFTEKFHLTPESLRMPYKSIDFVTEDGVHLNGWLLEPTRMGKSSERLVILMHPYNIHKSNLLAMAQGLWNQGFNVFLFDFRSFAQPRVRQSLGYLEQKDALAAINWCHKNVPCEDGVVLMGASMGASVCCCVAPKIEKVANLRAVVLDCPFSTLEDVCRFNILMYGHLPAFLVDAATSVCRVANSLIYGYDLDNVKPQDSIKLLSDNVPLMIIHSENDIVCPIEHGRKIYENCNSQTKGWWTVEQVEHCGGFFKDPTGYIRRVSRFLDDAFEEDYEYIRKTENQWSSKNGPKFGSPFPAPDAFPISEKAKIPPNTLPEEELPEKGETLVQMSTPKIPSAVELSENSIDAEKSVISATSTIEGQEFQENSIEPSWYSTLTSWWGT